MSTETTTADSGAGATAPAATPTNDAQAAQLEQQQQATTDPAAEDKAKAEAATKEEGEKKRNRTRDYINRLNGELAEERRQRAEYERRLADLERGQSRPSQQQQQRSADTGPQLEDFNFDLASWQQARDQWVIKQAQQGWSERQKQEEAQRQEQQTRATYTERVLAFADQHPDFEEAVGSIDPKFLTRELQLAIMGHANGPEIAYHLANNDEVLFNLASIRPELQAAAVDRLAARLGSASAAAVIPPAAPPAAPQKPITQAPPPAPRVGGRAVVDTPAEKLTDDQWYDKDRESRHKR